MTSHSAEGDLVALVADKNIEYALRGLLTRSSAFAIRGIASRVLVHPQRDAGCRTRCTDLLRPYINRWSFAMVVFDHEGCGEEDSSREELEQRVEKTLFKNGWSQRAAVIVIDPELENWVWSESSIVDEIAGWNDSTTTLRDWLRANGWLVGNAAKPARPKEAFEAALRKANEPRSAALYEQLARRVDFSGCADPSFLKFKATLQGWFRENP